MPESKRRTAKRLKILYVCSELAPLLKTGGLADVAYALPRTLHELGHDVRLAMPCYSTIPAEHRGEQYCMCVADFGFKVSHGALRASKVPGSEIPLYLIEHEAYFGRKDPYGSGGYDYPDNVERFCFFCLAVMHGIPQTQWMPDVVHCNDWHSGLICAYVKTRYAHDVYWGNRPTLFTIHNLAYQGRFPASDLPLTGLGWDLFSPEYLEYYGDINLLKGAFAFASKINTVSPRYAREIQTPEYGEGLDGFLRTRVEDLSGILNGVDYSDWNPATDPWIASRYSRENLSGKRRCKAALQRALELPVRNVPLLGKVSRIVHQKGVDVLGAALDRILRQDVQAVVLGTGDPNYEAMFAAAAQRFPRKMRFIRKFDTALSHQIEAGSDFFLMPSRFEPCGLSQMYSLAYGAVPIVRETGGLADSVRDITKANLRSGRATGIVFRELTPDTIVDAVSRAIGLFHEPDTLRAVRLAGMAQDFSWDKSAKAYISLYRKAIAKP